MFFVLLITAVFVAVSIYFFFRAEKLQRLLITQKRDSLIARKENKTFVEAMSVVSTRNQEFAISRLDRLKNFADTSQDKQLLSHLDLISPLIVNYSLIFRECLKGKGRLKPICQKCFENKEVSAYKKFVALMVTSNKKLKRFWATDNLNGFLFLVEALLSHEEQKIDLQLKNKSISQLPKSNKLLTS